MKTFFVLVVLFMPFTAVGQEARPLAEKPAVEARLKSLAVELRCLVCQNQTLADSNAPLAEDLRREVRGMIDREMSDDQIVDFLVTRYGDFVRYRPPFKATTALLWVGPGLMLGLGAGVLIASLRRRRERSDETTLSSNQLDDAIRTLEPKEEPVTCI